MGPASRPHKRKLRNYLLDRRVQLKITAVMVGLSTCLTAGLGYFWYVEMRNASAVIRVSTLSVLGEETANQLGEQLASQDLMRLLVLLGFAALMGLLVAASGIVMTHSLAGPLYKIARHMKDITNDRLYPPWGLRKGDQLQQFFNDFSEMHGALRARVEQDIQLLEEVIAAAEASGELADLLPRLRAQLARKVDSLREASGSTLRIQRPPELAG